MKKRTKSGKACRTRNPLHYKRKGFSSEGWAGVGPQGPGVDPEGGGTPERPIPPPIPVVLSWFMEGFGACCAWKGLGGLGELKGFTPVKDEGGRLAVANGLLVVLRLLLLRLLMKEELEEGRGEKVVPKVVPVGRE